MKNYIIGLFISLCFLGCSENTELEKTWIIQYNMLNEGTKDEQIHPAGLRAILRFQNDKVIIKEFPYYSLAKPDTLSYKSKNDGSLFMYRPEQVDSAIIDKIAEDSLVIFFNKNYPTKTFLKPLPRYEQKAKKQDLIDLLSHSLMQIDSLIIEFQVEGTFLLSDEYTLLSDNQLWRLDTYENELFLILDGYMGFAMQVKKVTKDKIIGTVYSKNNKTITLQKVPAKPVFDFANLIGEWEETKAETIYEDSDFPPPPPPPMPPKETLGDENFQLEDY